MPTAQTGATQRSIMGQDGLAACQSVAATPLTVIHALEVRRPLNTLGRRMMPAHQAPLPKGRFAVMGVCRAHMGVGGWACVRVVGTRTCPPRVAHRQIHDTAQPH